MNWFENWKENELIIKDNISSGINSSIFLQLVEETKKPWTVIHKLLYTTPFIRIDWDKTTWPNIEYRY